MSIEKRSKNAWRFTITYKGQTYRSAFQGSNKEALVAHDTFLDEIKADTVARNDVTLKRFVDIFKNIKYPKLADSTKVDYNRQFKKRILPFLGMYKLSELSPLVITKFYQSLENNQVGPRTVNKNHQVLSSVLSEAVYLQYLESNPCQRIRTPSYSRDRDDNFFTKEELFQFLRVIQDLPLHWQAAFYIPIFTGARKGEVMGLQWSRVDFDNNLIRIDHTRAHVSGLGVIEKEPKTKGSIRNIPMPQILISKLQDLKRQQLREQVLFGKLYKHSDYVIRFEHGKLPSPKYVNVLMSKIIKAHGLKNVTYHGLRHTYATLLLHSNQMPVFAISENLGHSDPTTHQKIYAHGLSESNRIAAQFFDELAKNLI